MSTTNKVRSCLFCNDNNNLFLNKSDSYVEHAHMTVNHKIETEGETEGVQVKRENRGLIVSQTHEDCFLEEQLKAVFVLGKILDLSEGKFAEYLRKNDGNQNPGEWFRICSTCDGAVEDCYHVYREMLRCRRKLEEKKAILRSKLEESCGKKWGHPDTDILDSLFDFTTTAGLQETSLPSQLDSTDSPIRRSSRIRNKRTNGDEDSGPGGTYQDDDNDDKDILHVSAEDILTSPKNSGPVVCSDDDWRPPDSPLENGDEDEEPKEATTTHKKDCLAPNSNYKCELCPAEYRVKTKFEKHCDLHQGKEETRTCFKCGWLVRKKGYHAHMMHHYNQDFKLHYIPPSRTENNMLKHKRSFGPKIKSERKRRKRRSLQNQERKTHSRDEKEIEEIPYYCDHCHFIFTSKSALIHHITKSHRKDIVALLECEMCPSTKFQSKQLLQIHCAVVHGTGPAANGTQSGNVNATPSSVSVSCSYCLETFPTDMKRDYHIAKHHSDKFLTCPICKTYTAKEYNILRSHIKTHDPHHTTMCEFCSKMIRVNCLATHNRLFHHVELGLKRIQCEECQKIFTSETILKDHMDFVHNHNEASCCPFCSKKFKWKQCLEIHIKSHDQPVKHKYKKGPFFCKICEAKFNVRQGLYYHMKRLHSDKYSFRCDKCGKGYCFENTLLDHQKTCSAQNSSQSCK